MTAHDTYPAPVGLETGDVEALSSYVQRYASYHGTTPGQLLHRILSHTATRDPTFVGRWRGETGVLHRERNINGFKHADAWLEAMRRLEPAIDLSDLTTTAWDTLFPAKRFFAPTLRWCPSCLAEDTIPHHRLLWMIQSVSVCPIHKTPLEFRCPHCEKKPQILHARSEILTCHHCGKSVLKRTGQPECNKADANSPEFIDSMRTHDFIRRHTLQRHTLNPLCGEQLRALCADLGIPHSYALARLSDTPKSTVWGWWHGHHTPLFPKALQLAREFRFDLYAAMVADRSTINETSAGAQQLTLHLRGNRGATEHDWSLIHQRLLLESKRPRPQAARLTDIARELAIDVRSLRRKEPELCAAIGKLSRQRQHFESQNRFNQLKADISIAIQTCVRNGVPVNQRTISDLLQRPGLFSHSKNRRAFAEVLIDGEHHWPKVITFPSTNAATQIPAHSPTPPSE